MDMDFRLIRSALMTSIDHDFGFRPMQICGIMRISGQDPQYHRRMIFLRRFVTILAGYFAAATAGLIVPAGFIFIGFPDTNSLSVLSTTAEVSGIVTVILVVSGSLLIPAFFVIAICEVLRIRNMFAYVTFGLVVAATLAIYTIGLSKDLFNLIVVIVTGIVAGFIYWRIAGRNAGVNIVRE